MCVSRRPYYDGYLVASVRFGLLLLWLLKISFPFFFFFFASGLFLPRALRVGYSQPFPPTADSIIAVKVECSRGLCSCCRDSFWKLEINVACCAVCRRGCRVRRSFFFLVYVFSISTVSSR